MTLGEKVLRMRRARGWSQEELADRMGISRQAVSRWESDSAKPDADKIVALCDLFGVSADYLLRENYTGERTVSSAEKPVRKWNVGRILLGIYSLLSVLCLFLLKLMSSIYPKPYIRQFYKDGRQITQYLGEGMLSFVINYNLEWLLVLAWIGVLAGAALIWHGNPRLRENAKDLLKNLRAKVHKG